jgi:hypothetical protein
MSDVLLLLGRHYYVAMSIGDPAKPYFLDVDTGSDLTWLQCDAPCQSCNKVQLAQCYALLVQSFIMHAQSSLLDALCLAKITLVIGFMLESRAYLAPNMLLWYMLFF